MKHIFTTLSLCLISLTTHAQSSSWAWAKTFGTAQHDAAQSSVTDLSGNTYVAGYYSPSGSTDVFVRKYDMSGNITWSATAGGAGSENATGIAIDATGNIYIAGFFTNSSPVFGTYTLTNATTSKDIFLVKYNSAGNVVWAKSAGGSLEDFACGVTTDPSGNVYVAGYFESASLVAGTSTLNNTGIEDMFLLKYDAAGTELWARSSKGDKAEGARAVKTDASGNVYVTGYFYTQKPVFGNDTLYNTSITSPPSFDPDGVDMFLVKYNSAGTVVWAKSAGGSEHEYGKALTISGGNLCVGGEFSSATVNFGAGTATNTGTIGINDVFVAKYDLDGTVIWVRNAGGNGNEYAHSVTIDSASNVHLCGQYSSSTITFSTTTLSNTGNMDAFLAEYNSSGVLLNATRIGGSDHDNAMSVTAHSLDIYVAGYYASPTLAFGSTTITNAGNFDMYLARLTKTVSVGFPSISENQNSIEFYPNPSNGNFTIRNFGRKECSVKIVDFKGSELERNVMNEGQELTTQDLNSGIYFAEIRIGDSFFRKKLIVFQ